ncbi:MAG: glycosyltransferase family 39 protein [Crocosphaera sp.]
MIISSSSLLFLEESKELTEYYLIMNTLLKEPFKIIIILIIVVGIAVRLLNLEQRVYWKDEVFTSLRVSGYTEEEVIEGLYNGSVLSLEDLQGYQQTYFFNNPIGTVYGLAKEEAQLPPLYFLIVKFWVSLFGNSIIITRSISALLGLIACFIMYLLCRELFKLNLIAWIGMALLSISPFYVIYSQEARPYSLWLLTTLSSSLMLLRALRINNLLNWGGYSLTIILGLYTSPFSLFLSLGQGVYVYLEERLKLNAIVKKYLVALGIGILSFSPWLFIIILRYHQIKGRTSWSSRSYANGFIELVFTWFRNITRLFIDFDYLNSSFNYISQNPLIYLIIVIPIIFLVSYSVYFLCRNSSKSVWLFIILWIFSIALPLIVADLILGGRRSGTARYLLPSYLALQLCIAYFLGTKIVNYTINWQQKLWQSFTVFLCGIGLFSSIYASSQSLWWNNDPARYYQNAQFIPIINQSPNSLVISDNIWDQVMTLSYSLSPDVKYQLVRNNPKVSLPKGFDSYFLYKPSENLKKQFQNHQNYQVKPGYKSDDPWLWIIEKKQ